MPKSPKEIDDITEQIYSVVRASGAPLNALQMKIASLIGLCGWSAEDAEMVNSRVVKMLTEGRGWNRLREVDRDPLARYEAVTEVEPGTIPLQ
jgi:hypothetical protein